MCYFQITLLGSRYPILHESFKPASSAAFTSHLAVVSLDMRALQPRVLPLTVHHTVTSSEAWLPPESTAHTAMSVGHSSIHCQFQHGKIFFQYWANPLFSPCFSQRKSFSPYSLLFKEFKFWSQKPRRKWNCK